MTNDAERKAIDKKAVLRLIDHIRMLTQQKLGLLEELRAALEAED